MFIQEMTESDCRRALARARLGRLACTHGNQPYIVPSYFVFQEPYLYGFTTPGQKVEWMRSNPLVCVELDEVGDSDEWTSIVVVGQYEELPDAPDAEQGRLQAHGPGRQTAPPTWTTSSPVEHERTKALELLQRHALWWEPGCASCAHRDPQQSLTPVFYRIHIDHITGRRATPGPDSPVGIATPSPAGENQGWLRRIFRKSSGPLSGRSGRQQHK